MDLLVGGFLERAAGGELDGLGGGDLDRLAGGRVAAFAGGAIADRQCEEAGDADLLALPAAPSRVDWSERRTASTVFCSRSAPSATAATSSLRFTWSPLIDGVRTGPSMAASTGNPVIRGVHAFGVSFMAAARVPDLVGGAV